MSDVEERARRIVRQFPLSTRALSVVLRLTPDRVIVWGLKWLIARADRA